MTKKQLLSVLTATTVTLLTTSLAYADETPVPVDPTAPSTEVVTPAPSQPELPVPDKPAEPETPKEELPAYVDLTTPSTGKEDKPETPSVPESPKAETKPKEEVTPEPPKPSEDKKKEELVPDNVSKDIIEKVDTNTGEVVFKPIVVAPNTTVVGTQNSQLLVRDDTGQTTLVAPETIGGYVNPNGTVTITDSTGAKKTLPKTGDKQSVLGYLGMMLVSVLGYTIKKKLSH